MKKKTIILTVIIFILIVSGMFVYARLIALEQAASESSEIKQPEL